MSEKKQRASSPKWATVEELNAEIAQRLRNDPEYRTKVQAYHAQRQERIQSFQRAEQPIVKDLREAGFGVSSIQDLLNVRDAEPYPAALPVLIRHLERGGYPSDVMAALGAAVAVPDAVDYWEVLEGCYREAESEDLQDSLALALGACATRGQFDRLVALVGEQSCGDSRLLLLKPIKRLGGERGLEVLRSLLDDPALGAEARAVLGRRAARDTGS